MEVNISHKTRQEILNTLDIAHTDLFNHAINEIIHLMKTVKYYLLSFPLNVFFVFSHHLLIRRTW